MITAKDIFGSLPGTAPKLPVELAENELPLSSELFSGDQMEQYGKILARSHQLSHGPIVDRLLERLAQNEEVIIGVCNMLTEAANANRRMTPAAEWLFDNYYLIDEQVHIAKRHLPKGYSRQLPRLADGPSAGLPRVYDIALATISHADGYLDLENLNRFVASYQTVSPLNLGELWAIPIMLRLALIENLRRVALRTAAHLHHRELADFWADKMVEVSSQDMKGLILVIADMARSNPPLGSAFVSELARRLQGQSSALALGLTWVEQALSESHTTIEQLVQIETQLQAADQVSVSNSISSLRMLGAIDWKKFVEDQSFVEQVLLTDPVAAHGKMDFQTRDHYRHVVERLAKFSSASEVDVARQAIALAETAKTRNNEDERTWHVGYYLIDAGLPELERVVKSRLAMREMLSRMLRRTPMLFYLGSISIITFGVAALLLDRIYLHGYADWVFVCSAISLIICLSQMTVSVVNWLVTMLIPSVPLPKIDYSAGIPAQSKSLVVVPTMLTRPKVVEELLEALEVRFLANREEHLHFALLTDFPDADYETMPTDEALVSMARTGIEKLNEKYPRNEGDIFFLFHRPRLWNAQENKWMGYERKRGKLADLNAVLRGGDASSFSVIVGRLSELQSVKYVITLDTDTQLPRDSAREFIGAMVHPLNSPRVDQKFNVVSAGYGILQPRVGVSLSASDQSRYASLYGQEPGIDPYTRTVSDVYQDLFQEGSFIGKGIYDLDVFEKVLKNRFPENWVLSHDLLEGCYLRSGLLTDVQLFEDYPSTYSADVSRRRRWIRGDWQIVNWLRPRVPGLNGYRQNTPISVLSRWKIFDNLRRSLVPAALLSFLLLSWTVLKPADFWTFNVLAITFFPPIIFSLLAMFLKPSDVDWRQHLTATLRSVGRQLEQSVFMLSCLPYEAYFSLDAIITTLVRTTFTRRRLLQWQPSADVQRQASSKTLMGLVREMSVAPLLAVATAVFLAGTMRIDSLLVASPVLFAWLVSPLFAFWLSRSSAAPTVAITGSQNEFLRRMARRTWAFFETYVCANDNWLPPDNVQEVPFLTVAHRTSPTNIGLSLLANLTAYDFGYIHAGEVIERTQNTLATMERLERYRGHLLNWYNTETLQPLLPRYVSTVDSGNLVGHLLTLSAGLSRLSDDQILPARIFDGLFDTVRLLRDAVGEPVVPELKTMEDQLRSVSDSNSPNVSQMQILLEQLCKSADALHAALERSAGAEVPMWSAALQRQCANALAELLHLCPTADPALPADRLPTLKELQALGPASPSGQRAKLRQEMIEQLTLQCSQMSEVEYDFLYDKEKRLLSIGFNTESRRLDSSYYDLLASEARLCSFVAIAQGRLPQESWFALGRSLTLVQGEPVLFSWSGSMFEYLMPLLVMPTYEQTLLDQTYRASVKRQIEYGRQRNVPWGISESGYNAVDAQFNYQYRAFGVPGLGLKRGLAQDLVIAPYATAMALMVAPTESCVNLERMFDEGFSGRYGFYEAVDYTSSRLSHGQTYSIVKSYFAHHQGMAFLSLGYALFDKPMQKRFQSEPSFQSAMLLLQERIPKTSTHHSETKEAIDIHSTVDTEQTPIRFFRTPDTAVPEVQLLSNGRYHMVVTNAGGGYSLFGNLALTRWREDPTCDQWGNFCYIRDVASGEYWSTAHQPTLKQADTYEAVLSESRVEFRRRDHNIELHTEIVVSSEDDIELRRVHITNQSRKRRVIELTSYAEVLLTPQTKDAAHRAFSNLFVQTEIMNSSQAILCTRRPQSADQQMPWMFHLMSAHGANIDKVSYETDRARFIGRGNTLVNPAAMQKNEPLSGSQGSVLDPIVAIRCQVTLEPEETVTVNLVTGISNNREGCIALVEKYQDRRLSDRVFDLAWTHSQVLLRQLNANDSDGQLFARLANSIIFANASLRAEPSVLLKNRRGQSGLWGYAISGDYPIVLVQIKDSANLDLVRQTIQAHAYWRLKGLAVDLVIWNEDRAIYRQQIHEQIMGLIVSSSEANLLDKPGGIFVRAADQISLEDRILMQSVARVIIKDTAGSLAEQLAPKQPKEVKVSKLAPARTHVKEQPSKAPERTDLLLYNGLGGFTNDGREYIITTAPNQVTPAPWSNVLANQYFGTVISESGVSYTWLENAHEFRLTPWQNDPVTDNAGEAFYIRDEETGYFWSPCPLPVRGQTPYMTRHGFGYSVFEHTEAGITSELCVYVTLDAPVKMATLRIRNNSGRSRRLSATGYVEWVLGDLRPKTAMHVNTEIDTKSGAIFARNPYNSEFPERIAFFDVDEMQRTVTGDRTEFVGRNGTLSNPAAMRRQRLSGRVGAGLDPCAALQVQFELADGQERELIFRLGIGQNATDAANLVSRFRGASARGEAFEKVCHYWKHMLGAVNVQTPDDALNMLANGWLLYQTVSCRLWGRSGYYQSGGAFGFRDQLQDTMALIHSEPVLLRKQLLLCASRQFPEGDVQHWWHPPSGRGVRTRISDDYLWLPLATWRYVDSVGDTGVLDEQIHYLTGRAVNPEDESYFDLPGRSTESATLYEHCKQAIRHGLRFGERGLPLMGCGDWNDGMNLVGHGGKGESVWLGFFLHEILRRFESVARLKNDTEFVQLCVTEAKKIKANIAKNGWDAAWYRRAYFDDGTPLGSAKNDECQIDSLSQSWSILSGAGDENRSRQGMEAVYTRLVRHDQGMIQLLDPPFDKSELNPGYIKGYVPGVRENGGQYTHGAIWTIMAFAALGDHKRAWELFRMINPINHARNPEEVVKYKVEPYVVAADVYAREPHVGRGGWTWYTGSAAWMYRLIIESLLGLRLKVNKLFFEPCLPDDWKEYKIHYRYHETVYHISFSRTGEAQSVKVDGELQSEPFIHLIDDRREHFVEVTLP